MGELTSETIFEMQSQILERVASLETKVEKLEELVNSLTQNSTMSKIFQAKVEEQSSGMAHEIDRLSSKLDTLENTINSFIQSRAEVDEFVRSMKRVVDSMFFKLTVLSLGGGFLYAVYSLGKYVLMCLR